MYKLQWQAEAPAPLGLDRPGGLSYYFLGGGGAGAFFHDGDAGNEVAEAGGLKRVAGDDEGHGGAGAEAVTRAADVYGIGDGFRRYPLLAAFVYHQGAFSAVSDYQAGRLHAAAQLRIVHASEDAHGRGFGLPLVGLHHGVAEVLGPQAGHHPD